jgi:CRISPR-associated protein Cas2
MSRRSEYAIAYDVSDDRERRRLDKLLKGWGFRVQKSVFECRLSRRQRDRLTQSVAALALQTGAVRIYQLAGLAPIRLGADTGLDLNRAIAYVI